MTLQLNDYHSKNSTPIYPAVLGLTHTNIRTMLRSVTLPELPLICLFSPGLWIHICQSIFPWNNPSGPPSPPLFHKFLDSPWHWGREFPRYRFCQTCILYLGYFDILIFKKFVGGGMGGVPEAPLMPHLENVTQLAVL